MFQEVSELGDILGELADLSGASVKPEVAIILDTENCWAVNDSHGPWNFAKSQIIV